MLSHFESVQQKFSIWCTWLLYRVAWHLKAFTLLSHWVHWLLSFPHSLTGLIHASLLCLDLDCAPLWMPTD